LVTGASRDAGRAIAAVLGEHGAERAPPKLLRAKVELLRQRFSDGLNYANTLPSAER
jgi:NAD(P)-dependent dehydrogenase (short-subunit alcohol dehydrogenase family)